jgi:nucleotide-binding universal stress UspA family protein
MAKRQNAELVMLHVVEQSQLLNFPDPSLSLTLLSQLEENARENLYAISSIAAKEHGIAIKTFTRVGHPAHEICRYAFESDISIIVMGTHGASGLREFFIGTNSYSVVKNASCPVMTIPDAGPYVDFKRILFPIRMVANALDKYHMIRPIVAKNNSTMIVAGVVEKTDEEGTLQIQSIVDSISEEISEDGVVCESEIHYCDNIAAHVVDLCNSEKPDLLVITATLEKTLKDFFVGPYTQQIVNHVKSPVLSIKPILSFDKE